MIIVISVGYLQRAEGDTMVIITEILDHLNTHKYFFTVENYYDYLTEQDFFVN